MFGLYPAGSEWVRIFATDDRYIRDDSKVACRSRWLHGGDSSSTLWRSIVGQSLAQFGQMLVLSRNDTG